MKRNIKNLSLAAVLFASTSVYAKQIVGVDVSDPNNPVPAWEQDIQFGYGGLNMDNINVNVILDGSTTPIDFTDGAYPSMALEDTYESSVFASGDDKSDEATRLGFVTGKIWPISEPMGIKVVNNDTETNKYKPNNCIMASSYLGDANTTDADDTTFFLDDANPTPVICSSYAGSSKRFQLVLNENMVEGTAPGEYGKSIDLVFNIDPQSAAGDHRYQVFQKVTNRTGMRLDGLRVEVLDANGSVVTSDLNISLGLGEGDPNESGNIWEDYEIAFYPPGLWGDGSKSHLPIGWFDTLASGYYVDGNGTNTITTQGRLSGNYVEIYGNWLPNKWVGVGMHEEIDPTIEPVLLAYWGTTPDEPNAEPAWHYGMYNYLEEFTNFASPDPEDLLAWIADLRTAENPDGRYVIDDIEDLPNLSLNYIVNVGANVTDKFIIRFTPKASVDQTPPSYFEDNVTRIVPPTAYNLSEGIAAISPEPTFDLGTTLVVSVGDGDLNTDPNNIEFVDVNVSNDSGDLETITLQEIAADAGIFSASLPTVISDSNVLQDGNMSVVEGTVVTVTYNDENNGTAPAVVTASTTATDSSSTVIDPTIDPSTGGGGCTYNPNSKKFDMMFFVLMALGMFYIGRKRFARS